MLTTEQERLSATFAALADPTRRAILMRLTRGEATVAELAAPFAMTLPAVSKHLSVLERAELIERGRRGPGRRCRLRAERLRDAEEWMADQRAFWEAGFDRLARRLDEISDEEERGDGTAAAE